MKTSEDFRKAAQENGIKEWHVRDCSMCHYPIKYIFIDNKVLFDSGCNCITNGPIIEQRTWNNIAAYYNMQNHPDIIKKMNEFWGFKE